jgi:shikimate kinase
VKRHIVLVGLPGAGKSVAGRRAAELLSAPFIDLDTEIARETGTSVAEIFQREGEAGFRTHESKAAERVLAGLPSVVSPGGGWAAVSGRLTGVNRVAYSIYLRTEPSIALERLRRQPGGITGRPLLGGPDPEATLHGLLTVREPCYREAESEIQTDRKDAEAVAAEIVALARQKGGW